MRLQLAARGASGTQETRPRAARTGPEPSLPAGSQPGLSGSRLSAEEVQRHRGARPRGGESGARASAGPAGPRGATAPPICGR